MKHFRDDRNIQNDRVASFREIPESVMNFITTIESREGRAPFDGILRIFLSLSLSHNLRPATRQTQIPTRGTTGGHEL